MEGERERLKDASKDGWTDDRKNRWMNGRIDGLVDWLDGLVAGWIDVWKEREA